MASSVPQAVIGANGVVVPPQTGGAGSILYGVLQDLDTAFGGNLNVNTLSTPQGQLASSIAAYIADSNALFSYFVSQTDPQYAQGFMQDAIGRIFGLTRLPATFTTVTCTCVGAVGTVIAAGAQAQDTAGNLYTTALGGTIGGSGAVSMVFTAQVAGALACSAGTLTRIMSTTPGWDSITNPTGTDTLPLTLGVTQETPQAFESRRQASLFVNGQSMTQAVLGAVLASGTALVPPNIPVDCFVYDNSTGTATTYGGMTLPPNSLYVAVEGGDPLSIATAIWQKKSVGAPYAPSASFTASISGAVMTASAPTFGFLLVGQTVMGAGVPANTTIISLGTGTGGAGTYNLSNAATVSGVILTSATQVIVTDMAFFAPSPTYAVNYTTPQQIPIYVNVSIVNSPALPTGLLALVQAAVEGAFLGSGGGAKARIGATLFGSRFYAPILAAVPTAQIANIQLGTTASPTGASVTPNVNQYPITGNAYVTVTLV